MTCVFLRNHKDNCTVAFNNALIARGEPWRLVYTGVQAVWADRNFSDDGSCVIDYRLCLCNGDVVTVDTALWILSEVNVSDTLFD